MTMFRITNLTSGNNFGTYEASTPDAALLAMLKDGDPNVQSIDELEDPLDWATEEIPAWGA